MFGNEQIIKLLHFLSYSKRAKNFTLPKNIITDFSLPRVLCDLHCVINKSLNVTPYLHYTRLRRITASQPPELIRCALGRFWSGSLRCITKDRHLGCIRNRPPIPSNSALFEGTAILRSFLNTKFAKFGLSVLMISNTTAFSFFSKHKTTLFSFSFKKYKTLICDLGNMCIYSPTLIIFTVCSVAQVTLEM